MTARYALYLAPSEDSPLWRIGCAWLGRDARTGASLPQPAIDAIPAERVHALTASPRRYGLHATLKPPLRLAAGMSVEMLIDAIRALATATSAFTLPTLAIDTLSDFIALRTVHASAALQQLADRSVAELDRFRQPADAEEIAQRRRAGLSARQEALLSRFGYPYVMDEWRFHITLTERVSGTERDLLLAWLTRHFAAALAAPLRCEEVCLFVQDSAAQPFVVRERFALADR
jgi:putative phosphonate metabolism protein